MSERPLSVHIYRDSITPNMSVDAGWEGVELASDIAPWIQVTEDDARIELTPWRDGCIRTDSFPVRRYQGDLNLILTERTIIPLETSAGRWSLLRRHVEPTSSYIGWAYFNNRVNSPRVALVNTVEIRRPDHTVAHEIGHLLSLWMHKDDIHCDAEATNCVGLAELSEQESDDADYCQTCTDELFAHATRLRDAKAGKLGLAANARVF